LAKQLVWTRPLDRYPGWHFDIEWDNPGIGFRLRRELWSYFRERRQQVPLVVPWYDGLRVQLYLSNDTSKQLFVGGCVEPNEFALLGEFLAPGLTFLDLGANEGLYTVFAAQRVGVTGRVWSVEPSKRELTRLHQNIELNGFENIRTIPVALGDMTGFMDMRIAEDEHAGHNTLGEFVYDTHLARCERVPVRRLDDLLREEGLDRLDVLKVDIEGAEAALLRGATAVLREMRPLILMEVLEPALRQQGADPRYVLQALHAADYRVYVVDNTTGCPVAAGTGVAGETILAAGRETEYARRLEAAVDCQRSLWRVEGQLKQAADDLHQTNEELTQARARIAAMEKSLFWKLRACVKRITPEPLLQLRRRHRAA
jgi:FkbM family methyltransferase